MCGSAALSGYNSPINTICCHYREKTSHTDGEGKGTTTHTTTTTTTKGGLGKELECKVSNSWSYLPPSLPASPFCLAQSAPHTTADRFWRRSLHWATTENKIPDRREWRERNYPVIVQRWGALCACAVCTRDRSTLNRLEHPPTPAPLYSTHDTGTRALINSNGSLWQFQWGRVNQKEIEWFSSSSEWVTSHKRLVNKALRWKLPVWFTGPD